MPRPKVFDITLDAPDADGLADNNDSSGTSLTLDGALTSGGTFTAADGLGHRVSILDTATVDQSGATFTVTGTDADGRSVSEAITGPGSGATVESTTYFKTITSVAIASGAGSGTVDMGTVDEAATAMYPLNRYGTFDVGLAVTVSGTIDATVQHTFDNPQDVDVTPVFFAHSSLANVTANGDGNYDFPCRATRLITNSYSAGATFKFHIIEAS